MEVTQDKAEQLSFASLFFLIHWGVFVAAQSLIKNGSNYNNYCRVHLIK